jgi:tetratricopeptide (TPR) repeat protein
MDGGSVVNLKPTVIGDAGRELSAGPISNLPPRNLAFTGRTELLEHLHEQLADPGTTVVVAVTAPAGNDTDSVADVLQGNPTQTQARAVGAPRVLHGLGGVGKTELALEYAHRHANDYDIRWQVPADQPTVISARLVELARRLGIPEQIEQSNTVAVLLDELGRRDRWLLIFDNAEDPQDLRPFWPPSPGSGGHVLVTSRNPNWQPLAATVPVDVLPRDDAIAFLQLRARIGKDDADRLAEALGDLPLALEQAAAYLAQTHTPVDEYQELLRTRARELFALGHPATSEQTIATIWTVSLQSLRNEAPPAEDLLRLCAFLAPEDIPRRLFSDHPDGLPTRLSKAVRDRLAYQQALGALSRYSMATVADDAINVHRLVQAVVRVQLGPAKQLQGAATTAVRLVRAAFPPERTELISLDAWPIYERLLPHALTVIGHAERLGIDPGATAWLLNEAGTYLWERADYGRASSLIERGLAIRESRLGANHPHTARSLNCLGVVLLMQGDYERGGALHKRALAIREARLGPNHLDIGESLHNLAFGLREQGDPRGARALQERALAITENAVGPDHPFTAFVLGSLAQTLREQGDLRGARTLHERALAIVEARLGPDHPRTARGLDNLGVVLRDLGDLDGARVLHERALASFEVRLGRDHPFTATSLNNLASILRAQGDLQAARILHQRALDIRQTRLGINHPDTERSRRDLAAVEAKLEEKR